jgi:hypothetical protein
MNNPNQTETIPQKSILMTPDIRKAHENDIKNRLSQIEASKRSRGGELYKKYLKGAILSKSQALLANCAMCMGYYIDGLNDCECYTCPIYPYMPYGKMRKKYVRPERRGENLEKST